MASTIRSDPPFQDDKGAIIRFARTCKSFRGETLQLKKCSLSCRIQASGIVNACLETADSNSHWQQWAALKFPIHFLAQNTTTMTNA
jgi:hypothetical protein